MELPNKTTTSTAFEAFQKSRRDTREQQQLPLGKQMPGGGKYQYVNTEEVASSNNNNGGGSYGGDESDPGAATPYYANLDLYRSVDLGNFVPPVCLLYKHKVGKIMTTTKFPFDPRNIVFSPIKSRQNRGRVVDLSYHLVAPATDTTPAINTIVFPIEIQTPQLRTPFGVNSSAFAGGDVKHTVDLAFGDISTDPELESYYKAFVMLDEIVAQKVTDNFKSKLPPTEKWINDSNLHPDMIPHLYKRITAIRKTKSTGKEYAPRQTLKIGADKGRLFVSVYEQHDEVDESGQSRTMYEPVTPAAVTSGSTLRVIYRFNGLWFQARSYSVSCYVSQLAITAHSAGSRGASEPDFVDDAPMDCSATPNASSATAPGFRVV